MVKIECSGGGGAERENGVDDKALNNLGLDFLLWIKTVPESKFGSGREIQSDSIERGHKGLQV